MKSIAILVLVLSLTSLAFGTEKKKMKKNHALKSEVKNAEVKKEADCDKPKDEFLKKIEEQKKAKAEAGKGLSLQGAKDTGCSL